MTRHVLDHPQSRTGRLKRYARLDALVRANPRKQAEVLRRMPKKLDGGVRLRRYLWIDRQA